MTQRVSWREHCHGRIQRVEQNINTRRFHAWTGPPTIPSAVRKLRENNSLRLTLHFLTTPVQS